MQAHEITLQRGMKKFKGQMFVGEDALYFVCGKTGSAWWDVVGQGVGGAVGGLVSGIGAARGGQGSQGPTEINDAALREAASTSPGGMIFEPGNIDIIKHTIWMRMMRANGERFGVPYGGFPKALRQELGPWTQRHGVKAKGML